VINLKQIYLDNSSTTKVLDEAAQAVFDVMTEHFGNPSSLHRKGIEAEKIMRQARENVADALGVDSREIYFTTGWSSIITKHGRDLGESNAKHSWSNCR
jgi:cysteine desulfurase